MLGSDVLPSEQYYYMNMNNQSALDPRREE
jgi:hypothetical protein